MADRFTPEQRHRCMSMIRSKNTGPEMAVRRYLHARGFRYRLNVSSLPGTPDIVLPRYRTVVFVNGCFWHGHEGCSLFVLPKTRTGFWQDKIRRNRERDSAVLVRLEAHGWKVITVWECGLRKDRRQDTLVRLAEEIVRNGDEFMRERRERARARAEYLECLRGRKARQADVEMELAGCFGSIPRAEKSDMDF